MSIPRKSLIRPIPEFCNPLHRSILIALLALAMSSSFRDESNDIYAVTNDNSHVGQASLSLRNVSLDTAMPTNCNMGNLQETDSHTKNSVPITASDTDGRESIGPLPNMLQKSPKKCRRSISDQSGNASSSDVSKIQLTYNQYSELVNVEQLMRPPTSAELNITETLRLIYKAYHREVCLLC
jgi:hypothetical protein